MADLTVTEARLRPLEVIEAELHPMIAAEAITKGQVVYQNANGQAARAQANAVGTAKAVGIATSTAPAGGSVDVLFHGRLAGYDLTGTAPGTVVYVSAGTAGAVNNAAPATVGQVVTPIGTVMVMSDRGATRFLFVDVDHTRVPVAL